MTFAEYVDIFKSLLQNLPGEDAHLELSPLGRMKSSEAIQHATGVKKSAVAVILYVGDELEITLTQRQVYEGKHSGQISFPGGKKELIDTTLLETAIRETYEEIGVQLTKDMYLGKLTDVYIPVSNFHVEPHVFLSPKKLYPQRDEREVKEVFCIKQRQLLNKENRKETVIHLGNELTKTVPCFEINERIIWGATAIILNELKYVLQNLPTK